MACDCEACLLPENPPELPASAQGSGPQLGRFRPQGTLGNVTSEETGRNAAGV